MYGWKRWVWVGVGVAGAALGASLTNVKNSVVGMTSVREVVEKAARVGDYESAQKLYQVSGIKNQVLGAETELEDLVYPEEKLAREIARWEEALATYPGNREIMRGLAVLYEQAGEQDRAGELREQVRKLDPNGE